MPQAEATELRTECRLTNFFGRRPGASTWTARPGQSFYFLVTDSKIGSRDDITVAVYFIRSRGESRGWVVRPLRTRKLVVTRNFYVVRDTDTRHALLALVGRHGSLDTPPDVYHESVRRLFASCLDLPASSAPVADDPFSGVSIGLVPALRK